jgi:hypothetical protein
MDALFGTSECLLSPGNTAKRLFRWIGKGTDDLPERKKVERPPVPIHCQGFTRTSRRLSNFRTRVIDRDEMHTIHGLSPSFFVTVVFRA